MGTYLDIEDKLAPVAEAHSDRLVWLIGDDDPRRPMGHALLFTGEQVEARLAAERERMLSEAELEHLRELLRVEQELALRSDPFRCKDIECEWYSKRIRAGDCQCHTMQAQEHRAQVRAALKTPNAGIHRAAEGRPVE